jgi:hypothetical protein
MPKRTKNKVILSAIQSVNVVKCDACGTMHMVDKKTFVIFYGNIGLGLEEMLVDGNIDDGGKLVGTQIFCRKQSCLTGLLSAIVNDEVKV